MKRYEIEEGDEVFCQCCEQLRRATVVDFGYGPTEYWGSWSNHVDLRTVCSYCESEEIDIPEVAEVDP